MPRRTADVVAPEARVELDRIRRRWAELPLDRAESRMPVLRRLLADLTPRSFPLIADPPPRTASARPGQVGDPQSVVPDLGPAVVVDQLSVLVWDAYATGRGDGIPGLLTAPDGNWADRRGPTRAICPARNRPPGCPRDYVAGMADSDVRPGGPDPDVVIVMGVSGSGKSTVAKGLSTVLGWEFAEGDAFHPEANVAKMSSGTPLTDEDRWPWLEAIGEWISGKESRGESAVVTCSALRRVYRDLLREGRPHVRFLHVTAESDVIRDRMEHRPGHYMPPSLLPSQLATLEPLGDDEPGVAITNEGSAAAGPRPGARRARPPEGARLMSLTALDSLDHAPVRRGTTRCTPGTRSSIAACILGILAVVVLITWGKVHPFLALMLGSAVLGVVATMPPGDTVTSFVAGFGATAGAVGILIALGAMVGKLLEDSGGANRIVATMVGRVGPGGLPWVMAAIAAILGLPLFFEVGVVLLVPVVILVAQRTGLSLMKVGIPALAGLSVLHGLVPPHPGRSPRSGCSNADLGRTLIFGILIAIPTVIVAGPLLARFVDQWVPKSADDLALFGVGSRAGEPGLAAGRTDAHAAAGDRDVDEPGCGGGRRRHP